MKGIATRAHARVYRLSGGRILGRMGGQPVLLLLKTVGRRTGRTNTAPLQFLSRDGAFVVVAANRGAARPPSWYLAPGTGPQVGLPLGIAGTQISAGGPDTH